MAKTNEEISIELKSKFEFYWLALTFSILGLSIQTAKFNVHLFADAIELAGWVALFISGLVGILRAECIPVIYNIQAKLASAGERSKNIATALQQGNQISVTFTEEDGTSTVLAGAQAIAKFDSIVTTLETQQTDYEKKILGRYSWMKWAFVVGIGCLLIARGLPPIISIAQRLAAS